MLGEAETNERGGFILDDGSLFELLNVSETPTEGASLDLAVEDVHILDQAICTWHTHPGETANLSVGDADTFVQWPDYLHAIIGTDGIRWYGVKHGAVINA